MGTTIANKPKEASNYQLKLLGMPSIAREFPVTFKDTEFKMETMTFSCGHCETNIPMADVHGTASQMIERVLDIDSIARCPKCEFITPFKIRVHSDRKCEWQTIEGAWKTFMVYAPTKTGVKMALKDMFKVIKERIFGGIHG